MHWHRLARIAPVNWKKARPVLRGALALTDTASKSACLARPTASEQALAAVANPIEDGQTGEGGGNAIRRVRLQVRLHARGAERHQPAIGLRLDRENDAIDVSHGCLHLARPGLN